MDEVKIAILRSSAASCALDIIPTFLLKSYLDSLLLPTTNIINLALSEGIFPRSFKSASVRPLLKNTTYPLMTYPATVLSPGAGPGGGGAGGPWPPPKFLIAFFFARLF